MLSVGSNSLIFMFWFTSTDNNVEAMRLKTTTFNRNYFGVWNINLALGNRELWFMESIELSISIYNVEKGGFSEKLQNSQSHILQEG